MKKPVTRIISDVQAWESLRPHWDALLNASLDSTPWQNWDYLTHWWRHMSKGKVLRIVVVERDGAPVMVFPLQLGPENMIGINTRVLEPIASLWDVNRPRFAIGEMDREAFTAGLDAIWAFRSEWDTVRIEELPLMDPQSLALLEYASQHGLKFRHAQSSMCPFIKVESTWADFLKTRGSKMKKNLRASQRKLETASGAVTVDCNASPEEVRKAFDVTLDLHAKSWKKKKRVGLSLSNEYRNFFRDFLFSMAERGQARVLILRAGGRPVASTIAFLHLDTYFSTEIVHDNAYSAFSPGTLLESFELEQVMTERRFGHYDFLGRFLSNKQRWTDDARATHRIYIFRPTVKNWLLDMHYFRAKPAVKRIWRKTFGLSKVTSQAMKFMRREDSQAKH